MVMKMIDKKKLVKHYFNDLTNYYEEYRKLTIVDIEKLVYIEVKLEMVIKNNGKYKIIYMHKTVNRFIVNRLPKLLDNFRFIKNNASDAEEIPVIFKEETLLDLDERDYNNIFKKYINNFKLKVGVEINSIDSFYYFIEKGFKVIIVNIDEVSNYDLSLNNFKGNIIHTLRLIRDVARESKVRLIIKSWKICDKVVIDKIFILGFREYIYSRKVFNIVKETLTKFLKRRKNLQKNNKR